MTARIFSKLIVSVLLVMAVALTMIHIMAGRLAENAYEKGLQTELEQKIRMIALIEESRLLPIDHATVRSLAAAAGGRLTILDRSGKVLLDSEADPSTMENHSHRAEINAAAKGTFASQIRKSATLGSDFLYVAGPIPSGVARIAVPLNQVTDQVTRIRWELLAYAGLAFLPAILLAAFFARFFSHKLGRISDYANLLARGDFKAEMEDLGNDELGTLGQTLSATGAKLRTTLEELEKEHSEMEKLERIRKDFVINVSHELRTPLASIQGYTETLLDGALYDNENNLRFLNIVRQNAERLGRLTADLLTISRVELKTQRFQLGSYYLNALLEDCIDSMRPMADKKNITIDWLPAPPGAEVYCDSESVHQIMSNLLDNALKYTPQGGKITVAAHALPGTAEPAGWEIHVTDTGLGIPAEDLPRLFERFYRVDKARSRELGGTGLGLAIVKHLTRAQGGDVRVESTIGKGSTFAFSLPTTINEKVICS